MLSALPRNITASAFDSLIAATALHHRFPALTANPADFEILQGITIIRADFLLMSCLLFGNLPGYQNAAIAFLGS